MSHRIQPSAMTKTIINAREVIPAYGMHVDKLINRIISSGNMPVFEDVINVIEETPDQAPVILLAHEATALRYSNSCIAGAMWSICRQVYRFDADFASELARQELPNEIPVGLLGDLPYPIVYIETPFDLPSYDLDAHEVHSMPMRGFAAWLNKGSDERSSCVIILPIARDHIDEQNPFFKSSLGIPLSAHSFDDILEDMMLVGTNMELSTIDDLCGHTGRTNMKEALERAYAIIVNSLLYILADNADVKVVHTPSRNPQRKKSAKHKDTSIETVSEVGVRLGTRIREARRLHKSKATPVATGRTVRPHIRRGHYAHYWVGRRWPGHPGDKLIVHYIEPLFVSGMTTDVDEVVHLP